MAAGYDGSSSRHPFRIGEVYSNRDGQYEVLSIDNHAGKMKVRFFPSGEIRHLDIQIQKRIWENIAREAARVPSVDLCIASLAELERRYPDHSRGKFIPLSRGREFPQWKGPYSPARGVNCSLRVRDSRLWGFNSATFGVEAMQSPCAAANELADFVATRWGGGRILIVPWGHVIKPFGDDDCIRRVVIGRWVGPGPFSHLRANPKLEPGQRWSGPHTSGLECRFKADASLANSASTPTNYGAIEQEFTVSQPSPDLRKAFQRSRAGDANGRLRVHEDGAVTTPTEEGEVFIGEIEKSRLAPLEHSWIGNVI